ncbi:Uncharacterized protein DBV15_01819 [Temnothorax longispinosus]|uniref:Uncharacterized protein n=1 Tax=Temnothorax longispinosus TaxID=300112 RepID=A0A4S2KUZ5_9HYME|nr:Uncharacterized protein DBV15_01819 [Temnothorax longispinosus]
MGTTNYFHGLSSGFSTVQPSFNFVLCRAPRSLLNAAASLPQCNKYRRTIPEIMRASATSNLVMTLPTLIYSWYRAFDHTRETQPTHLQTMAKTPRFRVGQVLVTHTFEAPCKGGTSAIAIPRNFRNKMTPEPNLTPRE